jgi:predicted NAD/FAD-dependent oxidoreductase
MSAYLHYGQVSPFRLAREAYRKGGKGPDKYLDELLIWRELSYHWCDRTSNPGHLDALPEWAQKTLQQETQTHRIGQQSWEQLFRGKSPDELWNMAQRSLLRHGELHNNIRMTWGKMLHSWTESPQQTLRWLIDLNNRLALDGRDPSSYGGLLWCLGLFDRPFPPQKPIFGTVRTRNSNAHKDRLDNESFRMHIERASPTTSTAIVGAGISGLVCAQKLQDQGHSITLFDKARGVGGRASTRISRSDPDWVFDHGLPFVRHTDPRFQLWVRAWENTGVLKKWNGTIINWFPEKTQIWDEEVYVGTPKNSALAEHLAKDLSIEVQQQITAIRYAKKGWFLKTNEEIEHGPFSRLILTLPPEQLYNLLPQRLQLFERKVKSYPQHALMLRFSTPISTSWDAARINHPTLYWMCRESSKPNRPPQEQWSILTQPSWSAKHVDTPLEDLVPSLIEAVQEVLGCTEQPSQHQIHRWRYSQVQNPLNIGSWWNSEYQIGACGDWMHGGSIEGAYLSGVNLAGRIMRQ